MAEFRTIFYPVDKDFVPTDEAAEAGVALLERLYRYDYPVKYQKHDTPRQITSGAAFDRFVCPKCKAKVIEYDWSDWWLLGPLRNVRDENHIIKVPCCHAELEFRLLDFGDNVGWASFQIDVECAGESVAPDETQEKQLEAALGCEVRRIIEVTD